MTRSRDQIDSAAARPADEKTSAGGVSLDVLCRRAERLIESVQMMSEQVDRMFSRPDRALAEANETARSLTELRDAIGARIEQAKRAEESCGNSIQEMQKLAPVVQQNAEGLIQRVMRARELSETFGKLMETGAEKIAAIESAADEARKARESIGVATRELTRIQKTADHWAESARQLSGRQAEFIASGNAAATRLRTLSDAGERLRDSVREDVVTLRELLRESRLERLAWEKLLARMPAGLAAASGGGEAGGGASGSSGKSAPAALADRVRRLTDFIRHAAEVGEPGSAPESAAPTATWPESAASIATRPEAVLPSRTL